MERLKRIYTNRWGYLFTWVLASLLICFLITLDGGSSWEEVKRKFWDFGVVALYAGIIAMVAPHTRFIFPCHNWYLAFAFWFFSGWDKLVNFYKEYPEASAYLVSFFGIWLIYSKLIVRESDR